MRQEAFENRSKIPKGHNGGYAALTMTMFVIFASLTVIGGLSFFSLQEVGVNRTSVRAIDARVIAESGVEDALYRMVSGKQIGASETLSVGKGITTVSIIPVGTARTIRSEGSREAVRQAVEAFLDIRTAGIGLNFGVQVGDGGLTMDNNSSVSGGVFSNGPIVGDNGATIMGDAFAAGASAIKNVSVSGNAHAHLIDDSTVGGYASSTTRLDDVIVGKDAHANELDDAVVNKDAYYNIIDAQSVVSGTRITPAMPPADLVALPLPIAQGEIDGWKSDAEKKGVIASGNCNQDWSPPSNPYAVDGGVIERNLKLDNNKILILKGTVWVKCAVDISNGGAVRLDPGYGLANGVLVADGTMHLQNNGAFEGSGHSCNCSRLMLLTTATGGGHHESAIDLHNNAAGAIFYAGNGLIYLHNNVAVLQLTGRTIHLENNAALTYESGLASALFSSGPSAGYEVKYWKQVE